MFILRKREPDKERPFRTPAYPWTPLLFISFGAFFLVMTVYNDWNVYGKAKVAGEPAVLNFAFGMALLFLGAPIYFFYKRKTVPVARD